MSDSPPLSHQAHSLRRGKNRKLFEEVKHKTVAKHGQSQGYKSIFRDLDVPVSTGHNVIRKFKAYGTVANQPGCGAREYLIEDCSEWWRKHLNQLLNIFKLTFRHKVRQFQLAPSIANSMKGGSMVGDQELSERETKERGKGET